MNYISRLFILSCPIPPLIEAGESGQEGLAGEKILMGGGGKGRSGIDHH